MKTAVLSLLLFGSSFAAMSQIGIGTSTPNPAAALDVSSGNRGFLPPRVSLTLSNLWSLAGTPTDGMMVYNTAYAGAGAYAVAPGLYYWKGTQWFAVSQPIVPSIYNGTATFNCNLINATVNPSVSGFTNGASYFGTATVPYTAANGGYYPGDGVTVNGLTLSHLPGSLNASSGTITYSLGGTWTGTTGASATFPLNLCGNICNFTLPIPAATFVAGTLNCSNFSPSGTFEKGVPTDPATSFQAINVTVATGGYYNITTATFNGVTFSASGLLSPGPQELFLRPSGTPANSGIVNYTIPVGTQTCTFPVNYADILVTDCSYIIAQTPAGTMVNGTSYTGGGMDWEYTGGNGVSTIPAQTVGPVSGLTLSHPALTVASTSYGIVHYTLSGTYTGPTGGNVSFPVSLNGVNCTAVFGDAMRQALFANGCVSCAAYDAAAANTWVRIQSDDYENLAQLLDNTSVAGYISGSLDQNTVPNSNTAGLTGVNVLYNSAIHPSSYIMAVAVTNTGAGTRTSPNIKYSATVGSGYVTYGPNLPNETLSPATTPVSYFALKKPTALTPATSTNLAYYDGGGPTPFYYGAINPHLNGKYGTGNVSTLGIDFSYPLLFNAITTTTRQW